jgi:hypothetical protein
MAVYLLSFSQVVAGTPARVSPSIAGTPSEKSSRGFCVGGRMHEYENTRRVIYGGGATFVPVCTQCHQYVKADDCIMANDSGLKDQPNATCKRCGRVKMIFEGFI